jgi:hypothetical protein
MTYTSLGAIYDTHIDVVSHHEQLLQSWGEFAEPSLEGFVVGAYHLCRVEAFGASRTPFELERDSKPIKG